MTIKKGDLVMVVKPTECCGNGPHLGKVFSLVEIIHGSTRCKCGNVRTGAIAHLSGDLYGDPANLKKIDPPADGDSLPTKKELEVAA